MPFVSQAQAKWAFATKQPWARRWGHKTRLNGQGGIAKLPQYVARKDRKWGKRRLIVQKDVPSATPFLGNASGPGGLFSASGLEKARREHRVRLSRRVRPQITIKSDDTPSGAMIAVYLPVEAAQDVGRAAHALFGDRAECPCDLHITMIYLGKAADIQEHLPIIVPTVQRYTQMWLDIVNAPIPAILRGYRAFDHAQEDGSLPFYRVVDSPILALWVDGLERALAAAGVEIDYSYRPYTPHVTVAYTYAELADLLPTTPATIRPVEFDTITMALGALHIEIPLTCAQPVRMKAAASENGPSAKPAASAGGTGSAPAPTKRTSTGGHEEIMPGVYKIRGNLCQVHGKFGPCDAASSEGFDKKPKKPKAGGGKGGGKAKPTPEEAAAKRAQDKAARAAEQAQQRAANRTAALGQLASRPNDQAMAVLDTLRQGGKPDEAMTKSMEGTGLLDKHADGSYTLSSQGHAFLTALEQGDAGRATEALAKGGDKVAAANEKDRIKAERRAERERALAERKQQKLSRDEERAARKKATEARRAKAAIDREKRNRPKTGGGASKPGKPAQTAPKPAPAPVVSPPASTQPVPTPTPAPAPTPTPTPTPVKQPVSTQPVRPTRPPKPRPQRPGGSGPITKPTPRQPGHTGPFIPPKRGQA